jgi:hypothetical protein
MRSRLHVRTGGGTPFLISYSVYFSIKAKRSSTKASLEVRVNDGILGVGLLDGSLGFEFLGSSLLRVELDSATHAIDPLQL